MKPSKINVNLKVLGTAEHTSLIKKYGASLLLFSAALDDCQHVFLKNMTQHGTTQFQPSLKGASSALFRFTACVSEQGNLAE